MSARYEEIAQDLQQKIKDGILLPGQQLKTEKELTAEYGAARNTVREAINRLKSLRLVESRQGSGNFVARPPEAYRITLTPERGTGLSGGEGNAWIAEAQQQSRTATFTAPEVLIEQAKGEVARELGVDEGELLILRHQRRFITMDDDQSIPWSMQTSCYPYSFVERGASLLLIDQDIEVGTVSYLAEELGIRQARYYDRLSIRPPDDDERQFFGLSAESNVWVYVQRRTAYDTDDRPCRYTVTIYSTDRNEFHIDVRVPEGGGT